MDIPVKIKSNISGQVVEKMVSPRYLLDLVDESDLVSELTKCTCQPIGETNVIECNCMDEWEDSEVLIGEEITLYSLSIQTIETGR